MSDTLDALKHLIHEKFGIDESTLVPDKPLSEYGLDSLSLIELMFVVEEQFHLEISDDQKEIDTLAKLAALIDRQRAAQPT